MQSIKKAFRPESPFKLFLVSLIFTGVGYGIFKGVIDNYLAEIVAMTEFDRGVAEFFRELPGLMLVFILAAFYTFSAERLYKIGAVIMLIGMGMLSIVPPTRVLVTLAICIHSLGEHIQLGMKNTLSLQYANPGCEGSALGYQNSLHQIGTLFGYGVVIVSFLFLVKDRPYKTFFLITAIICVFTTVLSFGLHGNSARSTSNSRFYFRKKFMKYYMLEVFYGARKQVFLTFGPYVLVLFYGASAMHISLLFAISAIACYFLAPVLGKIIDRLGYKIVMVSDTLILVIVCFFYGFAHHLFSMQTAFIICCVNYVLDSIISMASMASNVYVKDISVNTDETQKTISTGLSVNHLITILIALFGGWIWKTLGIETLFILSALLGLCNSAYAATVKTGAQLGIVKTEK